MSFQQFMDLGAGQYIKYSFVFVLFLNVDTTNTMYTPEM